MVADLGKSALTHTARLMDSLAKVFKRMATKLQWLCCKEYTTIGLRISRYGAAEVFSILRKSSDIQKPIRCVQFTKAVVRHADIRDQNPSLGMICPGDPHQRNTNAPKFEDRSQEETEWQEQGACEAAWKLAKRKLKLKEK